MVGLVTWVVDGVGNRVVGCRTSLPFTVDVIVTPMVDSGALRLHPPEPRRLGVDIDGSST